MEQQQPTKAGALTKSPRDIGHSGWTRESPKWSDTDSVTDCGTETLTREDTKNILEDRMLEQNHRRKKVGGRANSQIHLAKNNVGRERGRAELRSLNSV